MKNKVASDYEKNNEIIHNINKSELGVRGITIYVLKNHVRCQKLNKEKIKKVAHVTAFKLTRLFWFEEI
jgi:hypothetical protein